ncbi:MAG: glycosyltransferase [Bacteroidota bacterium]
MRYMWEVSLHTLSWYITWMGALVYGIIWVGLVLSWFAIPKSPPRSSTEGPPISVIIAAHNELANLKSFAKGWLSQEYEPYELILVLDRCSDGSLAWLKQHFPHHPRLTIVEIDSSPNNWSPKKWALSKGIQQAKHEWLALTDADCYTPPTWLTTLSQKMSEPNQLILGLGFYRNYPGTLNLVIQFETFYTAFQYIGFANLGLPYMGVGRNLAYTQSFFYDAGGFQSIAEQLSGDDDLLVNAAAKALHTTTCINPAGITHSLPVFTWRDWFRQKLRHISAGKSYNSLSQAILGLFQLSHLCFYGGLFVTMITNFEPYSQIGLYFGRIFLGISTLLLIKNKIHSQKIILGYPLFDLFIFVYNLLIVPLGLILKPEWKKNLKHPKIPKKTVNW